MTDLDAIRVRAEATRPGADGVRPLRPGLPRAAYEDREALLAEVEWLREAVRVAQDDADARRLERDRLRDLLHKYMDRTDTVEKTLDALRDLADRWDHLADGPDETWTDEARWLSTSAWHAPVFAAQLRAVLDEHLGGDQ